MLFTIVLSPVNYGVRIGIISDSIRESEPDLSDKKTADSQRFITAGTIQFLDENDLSNSQQRLIKTILKLVT